jgi:phosphodiesterase/alkaline phosphatase D-like protein
MDRRDFLRLTALGLIAPACVPSGAPPPEPVCVDVPDAPVDGAVRTAFAPDAVTLDDVAFPQGVMAGAMAATAATLWARVEGDRSTAPLRLKVWRDVDGDAENVDLVLDEAVTPVGDSDDPGIVSGIVKRRLTGLAPGTTYRYGLFAVDASGAPVARSVVGRVRTAIADDSCAPVTFGATTCTNPRSAPFDCLAQMAETDPELGDLDAVLHVGDMVYADGSRSADDYRGHWRAAVGDPGYRALLAKAGLLVTWDDHEFDNNLNPENAPAGLIDVAKAAFYENLPMERGEGGVDWSSHRFGTAVEVIRLDARSERQPSLRGEDAAAYLSREQMDFLKDRLKNSPCHFKVVMNSVPMTKMPELWISQQDRWQGYEPAREEILSFLEDNDIDNVWFISGDFHVGFVARLEQEGFRSRLWEVAVGPGGNLGNPIMAFVLGGQREDVFPRAQFAYGEGKLAATRLRFDPGSDSVHIKFTAADGEVLFDEQLSRRS